MHDWMWITAPQQGPPPASLETGDPCLEWETLGLLDLVLLQERLAVSLAGNKATVQGQAANQQPRDLASLD